MPEQRSQRTIRDEYGRQFIPAEGESSSLVFRAVEYLENMSLYNTSITNRLQSVSSDTYTSITNVMHKMVDDTKTIPFIEKDIEDTNTVYRSHPVKDNKEGLHVLMLCTDRAILDEARSKKLDSKEYEKLVFSKLRLGYLKARFTIDEGTLLLRYGDSLCDYVFTAKKTTNIFNPREYFHNNSVVDMDEVRAIKKMVTIFEPFDNGERLPSEMLTVEQTVEQSSDDVIRNLLLVFSDMRRKTEFMVHEYLTERRVERRSPNTRSKKFMSRKRGSYVKHSIPFAVELECHGKNEGIVAKMSKSIPEEWGVCHDGSLNTEVGYPIEIQSPILRGATGEQNVIDVCNTLVDMGFSASDKSCGMHIHLGGGEAFINNTPVATNKQRPTNLISLYLFSRLFEDVIVSFLPSTRRMNNYCGQFKHGVDYRGEGYRHHGVDVAFTVMQTINTLDEFNFYWYRTPSKDRIAGIKHNRYTIFRYMGINFHSLLKDNHLEIRYHSGTINYEKILYWVNLHGRILELCASGVINEKKLLEIKNKNLSLQELTKEMFDLLALDEDTVEYLIGRQVMFKDADKKEIGEIAIDKTKKLGVI